MSKAKLVLAIEHSLPLEAVTQTFAFLGKRGSGKTYGALRLVESMLAAHAQVVCLDPVGKHWSLRLAADGKGAGFDLPVIGGHHGDVPLDEGAGALLADLVVDAGLSCVIDVSTLRKGARKRFASDFAEQLFHRKQAERSPSAMHLVIEESQVFIPQRVGGADARMVGAFEDLVRLGRNYGVGCTLISQRPQSVNKEVLSQTECLVVFQTIAPQERAALREWIKEQDPSRLAIVDELPSLRPGDAYLWSPGWLRMFEPVRIAARTTFDASSTPTVGAQHGAAAPRRLTDEELGTLRAKLAESIERAVATDPKALARRVTELEAALRKADAAADLRGADFARRQGAKQMHEALAGLVGTGIAAVRAFGEQLETLRKQLQDVPIQIMSTPLGPRALPPPAKKRPGPTPSRTPAVLADRLAIPGTHARVLDALTELEAYHVSRPSRALTALFAGYGHPRSKGFTNALGAMRSAGLLEYHGAGEIALAPEAVRPSIRVAPGQRLGDRVLEQVPQLHGRILGQLLEHGPLEREVLAEVSGYGHVRSKGFTNALGRLRGLGLLDYEGRTVVPDPILDRRS
jgi:uncharacterized protein